MALDGIILQNINHYLQPNFPLRINKIVQVSKNEIVFQCFSQKKVNLLVSTDSISNRLLITKRSFVNLDSPSHFLMLLRKYCENGIIQSSEQVGLDRIIEWTITNRNDLGDVVTLKLMIELMGKYANIVLVNEDHRIIDAFNRIPPYENTKRTIFTGALYTLPEIEDRKNPFASDEVNPNVDLIKQFHGISPLLQREIDYRLHNHQSFTDIMNQLHHRDKLYITGQQFHCIPLTHLHGETIEMDLMEGLEKVYEDQVNLSRIKEHTGDLLKIVKRELKRQQNKLPKLQKQLYEATGFERYKELGDLLLTYGHDLRSGLKKVELTDFSGEPITIDLDERFDGLTNAQRYFQKYHKLKTGMKYIDEQIDLTTREIDYLEGIQTQIDQGDVGDAIQIRAELVNHGLIRPTKQPKKAKKKETAPVLDTYVIDDVTIYCGHSNIQNEYLSFKKAHKNHLWFHVKDGAGAHVVATASTLTERQLRFAANLAAYYSKYRFSSTVAVNYCPIHQIKKIPKAPLGMVSLGNYQTIYIDPVNPSELVSLEGID